MATIDELILSTEVELEQAQKRRARAVAQVQEILAKARREGRPTLSADEDADVDAAFKVRDQSDRDIEGIRRKLEMARKAKASEEHIEAGLQQRTADPMTSAAQKPAYDRVVRVGVEERTYHRGQGKGGAFLRDVVAMNLHRDIEAETRLNRHMQEERVERGEYLSRAVSGAGTSSFAGLVVPQYLTDMYAPKARALRPFADMCNPHDLPAQGMTVNISRITTGTTVGNQSAENADVGGTDIDDTLLTENVQTAAGKAQLSRQAVERGTGIDDVTMDDLQRAFATNLDSTLINQATTGLSAVANAITFDDAAPTVVKLYPIVLNGLANAEAALLGQAQPDIAVMHSRRWYWLSAALVDKWPMINQPMLDPRVAGRNNGEGYGSAVRGVLPNGTLVVVDNNVPTNLGAGTNQDEVYLGASAEAHLWEDPAAPQFIRAEQVLSAKLAIQLVIYGYFAYSFRRYDDGFQSITGTGLVTPTFATA